MSVTLIFKIAAVGILVSVLSQVLKHSGREEQAFLTSLAGLLLVLFWIIPYVYELFVTMEKLFTLYTAHRNLPAVRPEVYKNSSENRGDYLYCGIFLGSL